MVSEITKLPPRSFPHLLREMPDPPEQLYLRGTLPSEQTRLLAIVGSRKYSNYGKDVCEKLIAELRGHDIAIVSGLALGIDSIAHEAALRNGLATVAIPGSGLSERVLYPRTHVGLARRIIDAGGALLSEFEPDTSAAPYTFPKRNRIMAGMSHGVLIIEATERSGTLITARLGMEYNREVMTVPGSVFSSSSYGPHTLIKNGATPITSGEDILEAFGIEKMSEKTKNIPLSEHERSIIELLRSPQPKDDVIEALNLSISEAQTVLSALEIKGLIRERLGKLERS